MIPPIWTPLTTEDTSHEATQPLVNQSIANTVSDYHLGSNDLVLAAFRSKLFQRKILYWRQWAERATLLAGTTYSTHQLLSAWESLMKIMGFEGTGQCPAHMDCKLRWDAIHCVGISAGSELRSLSLLSNSLLASTSCERATSNKGLVLEINCAQRYGLILLSVRHVNESGLGLVCCPNALTDSIAESIDHHDRLITAPVCRVQTIAPSSRVCKLLIEHGMEMW